MMNTKMSRAAVESCIVSGPYTDTWESLSQALIPAWFGDAKFGIFTHWRLYTVPEYRNEWYSRNMYIEGYPEYEHHIATYGPQKDFGYKDFIPLFTAERFDAGEWLDVFKESGAQYYVPVAEHQDGYQMYRSELSHWNACETGLHRDVLGELRLAALGHGMHFAASNHRVEHWWFMGHGKEFDSDARRNRWISRHCRANPTRNRCQSDSASSSNKRPSEQSSERQHGHTNIRTQCLERQGEEA